jgi:hypothetical protein
MLDNIYTTFFVLSLAVGVGYVVRGRRRGDGVRKILDDAVPVGIPLFLALPHVVPHSKGVGLAGLLLVVLALGWKIFRSPSRGRDA